MTKDAEVISIHVLLQQILSSGSHSRNVTNRYEGPDGTREFHLDRRPQGQKIEGQKINHAAEDVTSVESWDITLIFIRLIDPHHPDKVRHHHLRPEFLWMTHCLNMFETCLSHGKVISDVSGVDVPIVLHACITRLLHPGLREIHSPRQRLRQQGSSQGDRTPLNPRRRRND